MTSNRPTEQQRATAEVGGTPLFRGGHGLGMGVAVVLDPKKAEPTVCGGRKGAVGWPGGVGGWWRADANGSSALIFLAHTMVERDQLSRGIGLGVYDAITQLRALASADDR